MIANMSKRIISYSKRGFDIPEEEFVVLKKWYLKGAINFKANGYGLQADLYGPCLEDELWKDVYSLTWLKVFRTLCDKYGVKTGISRASVNEYCKSTGNYKIYPVISTRLEDFDQDLEDDLMALALK